MSIKRIQITAFLISFLLNAYFVSALESDINNDGKVDMSDLLPVVQDFGKKSGFNPKVDVSAPFGEIDIFDVMDIVKNFGKSNTIIPDTIIGSGQILLTGNVVSSAANGIIFRNSQQNDIITITDAGNMGIGTGAPSQKLDVVGAIKGTGFILPAGAAAGYVLTSDANGVGTWQAASSSSSPNVWNNLGPNVYLITPTDNVGIGTSSPSRKLDVIVSSNPSISNQVTIRGYQASFEVFNQARNQNWYFGVNDASDNNLWVGRGYSPGQGLDPQLFVNRIDGQVTIGGTKALGGQLNVNSVNSDNVAWFRRESPDEGLIRFEHFNPSGGTPQAIFAGIGGRGTTASPLALSTGDILFILDGRGRDPGETDTSGQIRFETSENWNTASHGSQIVISTTPNGNLVPQPRVTIKNDGNLDVNGNLVINSIGKGIILKATDGSNCYKITVNNAGQLTTSQVSCL